MKSDISDIRILCKVPFALLELNNVNLENLICLFKPMIYPELFKFNI